MNRNFLAAEARAVSLGPCLCPGTPHEEDTATVLRELTWDALLRIGVETDEVRRMLLLARLALVEWSLVDEDGAPIPITEDTVRRLRVDRVAPILEAVNEAYAEAAVPNRSGAPSPGSRRGSASSTRRTRPGRSR